MNVGEVVAAVFCDFSKTFVLIMEYYCKTCKTLVLGDCQHNNDIRLLNLPVLTLINTSFI